MKQWRKAIIKQRAKAAERERKQQEEREQILKLITRVERRGISEDRIFVMWLRRCEKIRKRNESSRKKESDIPVAFPFPLFGGINHDGF